MIMAPLDLDRLLAPISGSVPSGPSLRFDPLVDRIKEARREDDATLPQGVWKSDVKRADWDQVVQLCRDALESRSKDLQIACWLLEALIRRDGFVGIAIGLDLITRLCETFWESLHPQSEAEDLSDRIAPLEWVNAKLALLIHMIPVTQSSQSGQTRKFSFADYQQAQRATTIAARDPRAAEAARARNDIFLPDIESSAAATTVEVFREHYAALSAGLWATDALTALLDAKCGRDAPSLAHFRKAEVDVRAWIGTMLLSHGVEPEPETPATPALTAADGGMAMAAAATDPIPAGPVIRSREEAYHWLAAAADYLAHNEPHTPTPYLLRRAIAWADLPFHAVLIELSRGRNDLESVFDLLGIGPEELGQGRG